MKLKQSQNIFHVIVNAISLAPHVIHTASGKIKHANVNMKIISAMKVIVGIVEHVFVRIVRT